jgi:hypothetical protein
LGVLDEGFDVLVTDALPLELSVFSRGHRPETRTGVTEDVEITLRPAIPVHVQVTLESPRPPDAHSISATLTPTMNTPVEFIASPAWLGHAGRCDASGIARLFADAQGSHTIALSIAVKCGTRTFIETLGGETGVVVFDTAYPQTFEVCVPAVILDEARSRAEGRARLK